ncbi:hypothetical protein JEY40_28825 [Bradyrhizobium japonicum]|nr:hypothetical protein [Bradyrhizobium japonicum]UQD77641.1 hypothetical protein JEY40_28825 [Bradyrhizobium japonicum]
MGTWNMTEDAHPNAVRRTHLLAAAHEEMVKFERKENEFRKKDREERAAELRLPLSEIKLH